MSKQTAVIHKEKLKEGTMLHVAYSETEGNNTSETNSEFTVEVHPDLIKALKKLAPHLARLSDQYDKSGQLSDKIIVRGFSEKGENEKRGVVITGLRQVGDKKLLINSPFQRFGEEGEDVGYEQVDDLLNCVEDCKDEVLAYLFDGKYAIDPQGKLFDEPKDEDEQQ